MLSSLAKRFILPYSTQKGSASEVEAAAVFAVAEQERNKGGGLIGRQPEEKLVFLSKIGYPIWVFPKNNSLFIFDGLGDHSYGVSYTDLPSAKAFMESLEANLKHRENYTSFLLDNGNYFQQTLKEKQFVFRGLISDLDFKNEFNVYRKEATEIAAQANLGLLLPTLEENTVLSMLTEFDKLQSSMREEAERLPECLRLINKTTSQYITEIDYEAAAVKEETEAKIRAQEELVNPEIAKLNKECRDKIKYLTASFDKELESLKKLKVKTQKFIEDGEGKIRLYKREAKAHSLKKHAISEKRWKEKIKQTQKELNGLKKELKNIEGNFKKLSQQKGQEISKLNFELNAEIKLAHQPLVDLQAARDAKMLVFRQETEKMLNQEKPVIEGLSKNIRLREAIKANFELIGISDQGLKSPALFYATFFVACYEIGISRHYLIIPSSTITNLDFSAKLKRILGVSKIKDNLAPRFKAITSLIRGVQVLAKQNTVFEDQLYVLSKKNNLLTNSLFLENVKKGLVNLTHEGWLSEREHQVLSNRLAFNN